MIKPLAPEATTAANKHSHSAAKPSDYCADETVRFQETPMRCQNVFNFGECQTAPREGESSLDDFVRVTTNNKLISLTTRNDSAQLETPELNSLMALIDESHDCPMQVFLDIGQIQFKNNREAEEDSSDTRIKICLCAKTWGTDARVEGLTCQEFLHHCRKLYNFHLEKKRLTSLQHPHHSITTHPFTTTTPGIRSKQVQLGKGVYDSTVPETSAAEDARTRSSTDQQNQKLNTLGSKHVSGSAH